MTDIENAIISPIRLTQFSSGAGCGCKIAPAVLDEILKGTENNSACKDLLVGFSQKDDAAVLRINEHECLISTTDFFTPIVDDPYHFGKIAAANALSDVYAMGGKPVLAISILGFPVEKLPATVATEILRGAVEICKEAGIPLAGGHSINIPQPVFGLAVSGLVRQDQIKRNHTAIEGDCIYLSKPIGSGIIATAGKRGKVSEKHLDNAIQSMERLNIEGERLAELDYVHALTDVTGFGLLGHLTEMCEGSGLSAEINYPDVPLMEGVKEYAEAMIFPDNTYRIWNAHEKKIRGISGSEFIMLCDPQTSGGLLISAPGEHESALKKIFPNGLWRIGEMFSHSDPLIRVKV